MISLGGLNFGVFGRKWEWGAALWAGEDERVRVGEKNNNFSVEGGLSVC